MNAINVPVTITPEASSRIRELGFQMELERMIEHVKQVVPELSRIEIEAYVRADEDSPTGVSVTAMTTSSWQPDDRLWWELVRWQGATFPPEVREHLRLTTSYLEPDAP